MSSEAPAQRVSFDIPAGRMAGWRWGATYAPPTLLFLHAPGLNASAYRTLLAPLAERFGVMAIDLRGHGRTDLPARTFGYGSWNRHRDDVIALIETGIRAPVTLAGHSFGAVVSLLVAGKRPDLVRGVAMIEPILFAPGFYAFAQLPAAPWLSGLMLPIARGASRRQANFVDRDEALATFEGQGLFRAFTREQIDDYLVDGLLDHEGAVRLACPPRYEARTYSAQRHDPWAALMRAPAPLICLRAGQGSAMPSAASDTLAAQRPDARMAVVDGATHMLPFERPDRARSAIESAVVMGRGGGYRDVV